MQLGTVTLSGTIGVLFQYRKRYGLHAILKLEFSEVDENGFNTASGMDCMQCAAPTAADFKPVKFQYRKRYGLHAM